MEFAFGFLAGSAVTFIVLALYGYKGMADNSDKIERHIQAREEHMYQAGYVDGFQEGQKQAVTISNLPVTEN